VDQSDERDDECSRVVVLVSRLDLRLEGDRITSSQIRTNGPIWKGRQGELLCDMVGGHRAETHEDLYLGGTLVSLLSYTDHWPKESRLKMVKRLSIVPLNK